LPAASPLGRSPQTTVRGVSCPETQAIVRVCSALVQELRYLVLAINLVPAIKKALELGVNGVGFRRRHAYSQ
jgi:hypothetical protein